MGQGSMTKLEHALTLAAQGFKVFPIAPEAKAPPLWNDWPGRATDAVSAAPDAWPRDANIGIHCEGLAVVDVDVVKSGVESFNQLDAIYGFPATYTVRTPSGGQHVYYRLPEGHPGVPNSVEALGKGLDIRSTGGYVVAPGSTVPGGEYTVGFIAPVQPAPAWLLQKLGTMTRRERTAEVDVQDAPDEVVERAMAWLQSAERSVKGAGGDQTAYRVACSLRDMGLSYLQACEAMRSEAWDYGCGWREGWLEQKPIRSAYKYAQNEPGVKVVSADKFDALPPSSKPEVKKRTRVQHASELADEPSADNYLVKHWLERASYALIFGAAGEGKTFTALDIGFHVATGKPWMGSKVRGGLVLYLAFEGKGGMRKRVKALRKTYGDLGKLYLANASMNLRDVAGRQELGQIIAELPETPVLIVIDTFARAMMGGDENSAQDVGAFNNAVEALIESTGACVAVIHHSGKNKAAGARGSSALRGAIDTELEVDNKQVISHKQRDGENPLPISFKLVPVQLALDADNEMVTSCVVEAGPAQGQTLERISGNARRGFDVLASTWPDNRPIDPQEWRDACREFLGSNTAQRFYDIKKKLLVAGYVKVDEKGWITRRME
jgi:hypothetical protein